jgi:GT2 family glycosyltransferase
VTEPMVGVLILNYNGKKWLPPLLDSLRLDTYINKRIYLVDNNSEDGSVEAAMDFYPEVTIIRMAGNLGYPAAYNLAMPHAFKDGCEYVIWANNDIIVKPGCIKRLVHAGESDPAIGVIGPGLLAWGSDEVNPFLVGNVPHLLPALKARATTPIDVEWVEGSFPMIKRRCIEKIGPLDPFLRIGWEDADFCRRARYNGWRVVLVPDALVHHYAGASFPTLGLRKSAHFRSRSKNYYVYTLTDPFRGIVRNVIEAIHLFLVSMKAALKADPSGFSFELATFGRAMTGIGQTYRKWKRDRAFGHPPILVPGEKPGAPEIKPGNRLDTRCLSPQLRPLLRAKRSKRG